MRRNITLYSCMICSLLLVFLSVSCQKPKQNREVVATVNNTPIYLDEVQKEIARYSKQRPALKLTAEEIENQLKTMIEKKLLIDAAVKKGLAENDKFIETIKTFWEQTLIRELIDTKNKEWADRLFVTEEEIQEQYRNMQFITTMRVAKTNSKDLADKIRQKMLKGEYVEGEEIIGHCALEDTKHTHIGNDFGLEKGEAGIFASGGEYIVAYAIKKEKQSIPPLNEIYEKIRLSVLEQKKQKAMTEWIEEIKKSSKITVNNKLLTETGHGR